MDIAEIMRLMDEVKKVGGIENFIITQISKPENAAKFGEVLNKLPDSVLDSFAAKLAQHMPPISIDAEEIVKATAAVLKPGLEEQIKQIGTAVKAGGGQVDIQAIIDTVKGQIAAQVVRDFGTYNDALKAMATKIQELQDNQVQLIQATVEAAFKANMQSIVEQISLRLQQGPTANPTNEAAVVTRQVPQTSLVDGILDRLPTILDAWGKLNPPANQNAQMWETAFKFWNMGFNSGNKTKQGVMDAGQASSEFIQTMMSGQGEKK